MSGSIVLAHAGEEALPTFLPLVALVMFVLWTRKRINERDATRAKQNELSALPGSTDDSDERADPERDY